MRLPGAIAVLDRFSPLRAELIALLDNLDEADWGCPTFGRPWSVKDVVAHLANQHASSS
jgi:mycothiol maleylpyruvate isomerase-like protein